MSSIKPQPRVKSLVFNQALAMLRAWLIKEFGQWNDSPFVLQMVSNPTALRQLEVLTNKPDGQTDKLAYPFGLMTVGDLTLDEQRLGTKPNNATGGFTSSRDLHQHKAIVHKLRAVNVAIGVNFRSDSLDAVIDFAHAILLSYPRKALILKVDELLRVYNYVEFQPNVSVPPLEGGDSGDSYQFETMLVLRTFMGEVAEQRLISSFRYEEYKGNPGEVNDFEFATDPRDNIVDFTDYYNPEKPAFNSNYVREVP